MIVILTIQCLFFGDGGLLALGANVWNMAFYGCFVGFYLIWRPIMHSNWFGKMGARAAQRMKIILASIIGCIATLQLGAFSVVVETSLSGIAELPFGAFCAIMQPIHLAIGLIEGLITAAVLTFVYEARPELIKEVDTSDGTVSNKRSLGTVVVIMAVAVALVGGVLSLFASSNPDGLEWSLEKITGSAELESNGAWHALAGEIQELTALLPDYAFKGSESVWGLSLIHISEPTRPY